MNTIFIVIALAFSLFYGLRWQQIWLLQDVGTRSRFIHESWFNFVGSIIGWICLYLIYKSLSTFALSALVVNISWQHIVLFIIGGLGITGLLPQTLWGISRAPSELMGKILKS